MTQVVTLQLPDEVVHRYRRGANAANKKFEEFLLERLEEAAPPPTDGLPRFLQEALDSLENLDNTALRQVAESQFPAEKQRAYDRLLAKNSRGELTAQEIERMHTLGDEARHLMVKKAHAYLVLKWRGQPIPTREELQTPLD